MEAAEVVAKLIDLPGGQALLDAASGDESVWLVGGAVRDLMLGRTPEELDVVIDGPLDRVLARLGGEAERHDRFGTATVRLADGRIDLASARSEQYALPGALPDVSPGSIDDDLQRRDFTINAIAIRLVDAELKAHDDALADLAAGRIRVLHSGSFVNDPTRLWRAARYSTRLGFELDEESAALAALASPGAVSGERLGHELRLSLREDSPTAVLSAVEALNPGALIEGFDPNPARLAEASALLGSAGRQDLLTLAACCQGVELQLLTRWLDHLQFTASERDLVTASSRWVTASPLRSAQSASQIAEAAAGAPLEAVALCGGENARQWLTELRHVTLEIDGDDLIAAGVPPGPAIGIGLKRALGRTLDRDISGRDEQLQAALEGAEGPS